MMPKVFKILEVLYWRYSAYVFFMCVCVCVCMCVHTCMYATCQFLGIGITCMCTGVHVYGSYKYSLGIGAGTLSTLRFLRQCFSLDTVYLEFFETVFLIGLELT